MNRLIYTVTLLLFCSLLSAQQRAIGTWKAHFPYSVGYQVEDGEDKIYCASTLAIFYIDKDDNSIQTLNKANGLSDVGVKKIKYSASAKTLIVAYENSNLDLLVNGESIYNLPDIKNKITSSSKNINDIFVYGNFAYLSTDIGVAVLDLVKREIKSTYVIGNNGGNVVVNGVVINNGKIFAATAEGVKVAPLNSPNLQNYTFWTLQTAGISPQPTDFIGRSQNSVFASMRDSIFRYDGNAWSLVYSIPVWDVKAIKTNGNVLSVCLWNDTNGANNRTILALSDDGSYVETNYTKSLKPNDILIDGSTLWIADAWEGFLKYSSPGATPESFIPNGPVSNGVFNMAIADGVTYLAAGGTDPSYSDYLNNRDGLVFYKEQYWRAYTRYSYGQLANYADFLSVAHNPVTNKVYYASFQGGLAELDLNNNNINTYDSSNSPIRPVTGTKTFRVTAVCVDALGNTWMSNANSPRPLIVLKPDGTWKSFNVPYSFSSTRKMIAVDGAIWMCNRPGNIIVYNPGEDIDDESDDQYRSLGSGTGSGGLPNNSAWSIVEDKNGDVWVGTDEGIGTFYCASSVLTSSGCDADKIKVDRDGFIGYLFSTESVKAIAVDGANRKWVGSGNGVWLISADGKNELLRFTKDNSPLPSNFITDIKVNDENGEVFIGTENGLVSYQGDAIKGGEKKGVALVYPNPVQPSYTGPIAIKGLVDDAYVKITDAAGVLVYQGKANGGQMIWDGKGYTGNRVKSGVYIVYSATELGKEKSVAKIVLLN